MTGLRGWLIVWLMMELLRSLLRLLLEMLSFCSKALKTWIRLPDRIA